MSVYQRKQDGLWLVGWRENGKKKTKAFKSEQLAIAFEQSRLEKLREQDDNRITVGELVASFFQSHPHFHPTTKEKIIVLIAGRETKGKHKDGAAEFLFDKYADALTRQDLEFMRKTLWEHGLSNETINKYQAYIRSILAWGVDQDLIARNPWRDYKRLPVKRKHVIVNLSDIQKIYQASPDWLQWAIKTMYALTLRAGHVELFSLLWTAFDWQRGAVVIVQAKSGRLKTVFPPRSYMEEAYLRYQEDMRSGIPLVCHKKGGRVLNYRSHWDRSVKDANVPHIPMTNIRHASITAMLSHGADLAAVAAQAGHSTVTTTSTFYAHVTPGGQQRAASLLPEIDDKNTLQK